MSIEPKEWNSTIIIFLKGVIEGWQLLVLRNEIDSFLDIIPFFIQFIFFNLNFRWFHYHIFYFLLLNLFSFRFCSRSRYCFPLCKQIGNRDRSINLLYNCWNRLYRLCLKHRSLWSFDIVKSGVIIIWVECKSFSLTIKHISGCIDLLQIIIILHIKFSSQLSHNIFLLLLRNHFYFF